MYILTGCINSLIKKNLLKLINIQRCSYIQNPTANKQHITSLRSTNSPAFVSKKTGHLKWEREVQRINICQKKKYTANLCIHPRALPLNTILFSSIAVNSSEHAN